MKTGWGREFEIFLYKDSRTQASLKYRMGTNLTIAGFNQGPCRTWCLLVFVCCSQWCVPPSRLDTQTQKLGVLPPIQWATANVVFVEYLVLLLLLLFVVVFLFCCFVLLLLFFSCPSSSIPTLVSARWSDHNFFTQLWAHNAAHNSQCREQFTMPRTIATNVTLHLLELMLWGHIWKRAVEKSQTNATNVTLPALIQVLYGDIWKA